MLNKDEKIKFNYIKLVAWLTAQNVCGPCTRDESECDACLKYMKDHVMKGDVFKNE